MLDNFTLNKITPINEQIADELKNTRLQNGLKLEKVAEKLKINIKYLRILEAGELKKLPAGIYGRNFLKEYALFLQLDVDRLLELFDNETGEKNNQKPKNIFIKKTGNAYHFITIPRIIKNLIIMGFVAIIVAYLAYSINNIISAPKMTILYPEKDLIIEEHSITIKGQAEPESKITINEETVLMNVNFSFEKTINLKQGINNIEIVAQKKYSKKNIINRKILVK
jgi:transcriptional regulator with XRE-family HTH domain